MRERRLTLSVTQAISDRAHTNETHEMSARNCYLWHVGVLLLLHSFSLCSSLKKLSTLPSSCCINHLRLYESYKRPVASILNQLPHACSPEALPISAIDSSLTLFESVSAVSPPIAQLPQEAL